jgi:hypothetical protein
MRWTLWVLFAIGCTAEDPGDSHPVVEDDSSVDDDSAADDDTAVVDDSAVTDGDGDGWSTHEDCDDADPMAYPGAYDRPADGVDQDCDGVDRSCECTVVDGVVVEPYELDLTGQGDLDVAYLIDTTSSMALVPGELAATFPDVVAAIEPDLDSVTYGVATFDDYAFGGLGSSSYDDRPFALAMQQTDDEALVQSTLDTLPIHGGSDGPESAFEALYQALTGAGYDLDCDGGFDPIYDVRPFLGTPSDPFGGSAGGRYDASVSGTGMRGGMGFREAIGGTIVLYFTDNYMRDPDDPSYGSPEGCPADAGFAAVQAAVPDDVWLVGIGYSSLPLDQMKNVAEATGSMADLDGDDVADALVFEVYGTDELTDAIAAAVEAIRTTAGISATFASVSLEVRSDPLGIVSSISPASYTSVDVSTTSLLDFEITYDVTSLGVSAEPRTTIVELALVADGADVRTLSISVEVPPS